MNKLFSVIITNYNQWEYIFNAINSVIKQDYNNIELIITDDASKNFDSEQIKRYLSKSKIKNIKFILNEKNIGTVKTLFKGLKECSGEYILFFAADDELNDKKILSTFASNFKNSEINIVSSICNICDNKLENVKFEFPTRKEIEKINNLTSFEQYKLLLDGTIVAPGATAFRSKIIKKREYLNSKNKYIEDWELFLKLTFHNQKIYVLEKYGLNHRGGGISENKNLSLSMKKSYLKDFDNIFKKIIIPSYLKLSKKEIKKSIEYYNIFNNFYDYKSITIKKRYNFVSFLYDKIFNYTMYFKIIISLLISFLFLVIDSSLILTFLIPCIFIINYSVLTLIINKKLI